MKEVQTYLPLNKVNDFTTQPLQVELAKVFFVFGYRAIKTTLFTHNPSLNSRMLLALVASLVIFVLDTRFDYFQPVRAGLASILYPIQAIAALPVDIQEGVVEIFQSRKELQEKNEKLASINLLNQVRLQKLKALERENLRLRELLGSSFRLSERVFVAEVIRVDLDPHSQEVLINKGANSGVFIGQPVLDAYGVMGQVIEVSQFSSRVVLLTDQSHSIPVQINRNGLRSIASGNGWRGTLKLEHLTHNADIRSGDLLVTSGLGGRFPIGYPVGEVETIEFPDGKAFIDVTIKPAAKLASSRQLLLVMPSETMNQYESE
jgi:rod shape-determining protein MreC